MTSAVSGQIMEPTVESHGDASSNLKKAEVSCHLSNNDKDDRLPGIEHPPGKSSEGITRWKVTSPSAKPTAVGRAPDRDGYVVLAPVLGQRETRRRKAKESNLKSCR